MTTPVRIGINGFGRIGRCLFKNVLQRGGTVAGINDLADLGDLAYLLKYDSVHGWWNHRVSVTDHDLVVDGVKIPFFTSKDPAAIPWGASGADVVFECSGAFRKRADAAKHLAGGAKKVVISAPADDPDGTFVLGVNGQTYDPAKHHVVSMASCTTNSLAPVAKVLNDTFGIEHLMITTVHAYTSSQSLMDAPTRKRRRGRAAALSIVPTSTGAAKATALVIPELKGKMDGMALRVPVPDGSITDIVVTLKKDVTPDSINAALAAAAETPALKGILRVADEALVSSDILGDSHSAIVDRDSTMVLDKRIAKILVWYDNEWGYSARLADFAALLAARGF